MLGPMTRYLSIDEANAALPDLARVLEGLRAQRAELLRLRDLVTAGAPAPPEATQVDPRAATDRYRLRIAGIADQMAAGVLHIEALGATLRDIEHGLVDFPALAAGRPIWLCWRLGEPLRIGWWHALDAGFSGRRPLAELD
jgi:hypothetical protein